MCWLFSIALVTKGEAILVVSEVLPIPKVSSFTSLLFPNPCNFSRWDQYRSAHHSCIRYFLRTYHHQSFFFSFCLIFSWIFTPPTLSYLKDSSFWGAQFFCNLSILSYPHLEWDNGSTFYNDCSWSNQCSSETSFNPLSWYLQPLTELNLSSISRVLVYSSVITQFNRFSH